MTTSGAIKRTYLLLLLCNTLAASLIWGINTIFLLNAGLSNFEAFAANAFFTLGQVLFEVPIGIVADTWGRKISYILGTLTLIITTALYWFMWQTHAPFIAWAIVSMGLGLGFTFFSGAFEAWLVDALKATGYQGSLDDIFAKGQIVMGIAMLIGSSAGGFIAQFTNLGVPYLLRAGILFINFILAVILMKDLGFTPDHSKKPLKHMKHILALSIKHGFNNRKISWILYAAPFGMGISIYIFYALQPYLLTLYGDSEAYWIAGLVAAIVAGSQIVGGLLAPYIKKFIVKPTMVFIIGAVISSLILLAVGFFQNFFVVLFLIVLWALVFSAITPIRQRYLNENIRSEERATILSFDNLLASTGGIVFQPILGKAADMWNYPTSYLISSVFQLVAIPLLIRANKEDSDYS